MYSINREYDTNMEYIYIYYYHGIDIHTVPIDCYTVTGRIYIP